MLSMNEQMKLIKSVEFLITTGKKLANRPDVFVDLDIKVMELAIS
jgi:hypothetical protein